MVAGALLLLTLPFAAQQRAVVFTVYGGGADHLADLAPGATTWFMPGYNAGASIGVQLSRIVAVHGDFTYTRNPTEGTPALGGQDVNRFFYGVHAELSYPMARGVSPYIFAGVGAVSIDQLGIDAFRPTTRGAVMYGGGMFYAIPKTRFDVLCEIKGLTYRWNMAGFHRNMVDVTFAGGLSYRLPI